MLRREKKVNDYLISRLANVELALLNDSKAIICFRTTRLKKGRCWGKKEGDLEINEREFHQVKVDSCGLGRKGKNVPAGQLNISRE